MSKAKESTQPEQQNGCSELTSNNSFGGAIDWKSRRAEQREKDVKEIRKTGIAKIISYHTHTFKNGGTQRAYIVLCECGSENKFYAQSWAANKRHKCFNCEKYIYKSTLIIEAL